MNRVFPYLTVSTIPFQKIAYRLGYPALSKMEPSTGEGIEALIRQVTALWKPKGVVREDEVTDIGEDRIITENMELPGENISRRFEGSSRISCMAATCGPEAMEWKEEFHRRGELTKEVMADAILSELADQLIEDLNKILSREAVMKGYGLTMRYSAGYGDFPLSFQKILLDFLGAQEIGIHLNSSYIMIPEKSVTAVVGWIKK